MSYEQVLTRASSEIRFALSGWFLIMVFRGMGHSDIDLGSANGGDHLFEKGRG